MTDLPSLAAQTSRRAFLRGAAVTPKRHIASLVVQVWPAKVSALRSHLGKVPGIDIHGAKDGKLIVTVDALGDGQLMDLIGAVEAADGVVAASLVYHQLEDLDHG